MKLLTTGEACQIMASIIKRQAILIEKLIEALGPFEAYKNELESIDEQKKRISSWMR